MTLMDRGKVAEVIKLAECAALGMKEASDGKPPETITKTNAKTFANLAGIMEDLVTVIRQAQAERTRMLNALERIANLKVRPAALLLEQKNWQKLLTEVQAIAQDTLDR